MRNARFITSFVESEFVSLIASFTKSSLSIKLRLYHSVWVTKIKNLELEKVHTIMLLALILYNFQVQNGGPWKV